jgi:hypothetical protein
MFKEYFFKDTRKYLFSGTYPADDRIKIDKVFPGPGIYLIKVNKGKNSITKKVMVI